MNPFRFATFALLVSLGTGGCECGRVADSVPPAAEEQKQRSPAPSTSSPPSAARAGPGLGSAADGVAGGGAASPSARAKETSRGAARDVVRSIESFFDGDSLVVQRNGVRRISCEKACDLEVTCGFRENDACRAGSCDGDVRTPTRMDYCLALDDSVTCLDAAACSCAESCWKRGECAKDHGNDDDCERSCRTLVNQDPIRRYVENRCVLEKACSEIATCGSVNGP